MIKVSLPNTRLDLASFMASNIQCADGLIDDRRRCDACKVFFRGNIFENISVICFCLLLCFAGTPNTQRLRRNNEDVAAAPPMRDTKSPSFLIMFY